jgi:putative PIN family toxin of toxin-antitoxin system
VNSPTPSIPTSYFPRGSNGSAFPAQVLDLVAPGILTPCISDAILAEYLDVLTRPVLRPHAARDREVLELMAKFAVHVSPTQKLSLCSDPDDDCFLECALAAEAEYIVTGNARHFPKDYEAVAIVTPRQFLQRVVVDKP